MKRIILLAGPTASGKSAAALNMAQEIGGEIVNSDSMQIYAELRVLTARPSAGEEAQYPHHLYGTRKGNQPCSAEDWRKMAMTVIEDIWHRGAIPIVAGGTGLYFKCLTQGLSPIADIDPQVRQEVRDMVSAQGAPEGHKRLAELDPAMALRLDKGDSQRLSRALEVILSTGKSLALWQSLPPTGGLDGREDIDMEKNVILRDRAELYARCDKRFRFMIEEGEAIEEVRALQILGYGSDLPVMKSLGVPQIARYLAQEISLEEAINLSQMATRQFAKRQMTWFRNQCADWNPLIL